MKHPVACIIACWFALSSVYGQNNSGSQQNDIVYRQTINHLVFTLRDTTQIVSAYWSFGDPVSGTANNGSGRLVEHLYSSPGSYPVSVMLVYSSARNETLNTNVVVEDPATKITFPNVMTPNGDKKNDDFGPEGPILVNCKLSIFNRWGEKLFEQESANPRWDGMAKGQPCADGVYYYTAKCSYYKNSELTEENFQGTVTVIK